MASPLTSLDREEIFIADTTKLARLFFEKQHEQKVTALVVAKGGGHSRPVPSPAVTDDDDHLAAAEYVGRRLREIAAANNDTLMRGFERYVAGLTQTIWDINYEVFQRIMSDVITSQQSHLDRIALTFAGALHISEAVRVVGNDTSLQNQYLNQFAGYAARFIVDQGLMSWVEKQGGWREIGNTSANGTAV